MFCSVIVSVCEMTCSGWLPKAMLAGETCAFGFVPFPVMLTCWPATFSVAVRAPVAPGVKSTFTVHVVLAVTVLVQPVGLKSPASGPLTVGLAGLAS